MSTALVVSELLVLGVRVGQRTFVRNQTGGVDQVAMLEYRDDVVGPTPDVGLPPAQPDLVHAAVNLAGITRVLQLEQTITQLLVGAARTTSPAGRTRLRESQTDPPGQPTTRTMRP